MKQNTNRVARDSHDLSKDIPLKGEMDPLGREIEFKLRALKNYLTAAATIEFPYEPPYRNQERHNSYCRPSTGR